MSFTDGRSVPEAILTAASDGSNVRVGIGATVTSVPNGYTATIDAFGNLTVTGPAAHAVAVSGQLVGGVAWSAAVDVAPTVQALSDVRDLAQAALPASGLAAAVAALLTSQFPSGLTTDAELTTAVANAIAAEVTRANAAYIAGTGMAADLSAAGHRITNLLDPASPQDAATRAYVLAQISALVNGAPALLDTLGEIAAQLATDESAVGALTTALALKAPLASPALTGTPTAPTAAPGTNTTQVATTGFTTAAVAVEAAARAAQYATSSTAFTPRSNNTSETVPVGTSTRTTTAGVTKTLPALAGSVTPPYQQARLKNASTGTITAAFLAYDGTATNLTMLAGETLTFTQDTTLGWSVDAGNKTLNSLDARFAPIGVTAPVTQGGSGVVVTSGVAIDKPGVFIPAGWGSTFYAARNAHASSLCEIVVFGDSTTYGQMYGSIAVAGEVFPWVQWLRALMVQAGYTDGGYGQTTYPLSASGSDDLGRSLTGLDDTQVVDSLTGTAVWGGGPTNVLPAWSLSFQTSTNGNSITLRGKGTSARLFYLKSQGFVTGTFTYSVNGAAAVTVDATSATSSFGVVTLTGLPGGGAVNSIKVTCTSAYVAFSVDWLNAAGLVFHNGGVPGISFGARFDYTAGGNSGDVTQANSLAIGASNLSGPVGPRTTKLMILHLGINDQQGAADFAGIQTNAGTIAMAMQIASDACRAAGADLLVVIPHLGFSNQSQWRGAIESSLYTSARANGAAVIDFNYALGYGTARASVSSSGGHLDRASYQKQAKFLFDQCLNLNPPTITPVQLPPAARLTVSALSGVVPATITLDASRSYPRQAGATITSYTFDKGDGSATVTQAGAVLTTSYASAGTYSPSVTATDSNGKTSVATVYNALTTTSTTYLLTASFTGADATTMASYTTDTGQSATGNTSNIKILSNRLHYVAGTPEVAWDAGVTGKTVQADFVRTGAVVACGLIAAYVDASNYVAAFWDNSGNTFKFYAKVGGSGTFGSVSAAAYNMTTGIPRVVTAQVTGGNLVVTCDGVTALTAALSGPQATAISGYTKYGVYMGGTTVDVDNLHVY